MSATSSGRMFLSHNFTLPNTVLPALSRAEFVQVFIDGLADQANIHCRPLDNPHWVVGVTFDPGLSPQTVGQLCVQALAKARAPQLLDEGAPTRPRILALGGTKTTPATSDSPDVLQTGDWGVDVVETLEPESFLTGIQWDSISATKPADAVFKIEGQI